MSLTEDWAKAPPIVLTDGLCRIVSVTGLVPQAGCRGELRTDYSEVLGIFAVQVLQDATTCCREHSRVRLDIKTSQKGHRYVTKITPLDTSINPTPCLRCGAWAILRAPTSEVPSAYHCSSCHALWFLEPITRSYAP